MNLSDFRKAGHFPTLLCAFLYFDISFMIWVLLGPLANKIIGDVLPPLDGETPDGYVTRTAPCKGLMVAGPILDGALLRLVLGFTTDRYSAKWTGVVGMLITAVPLMLGWLWASSFVDMLVVGALLGIAGASFAAALPLASRWYPPKYQGLAMGIAGSGNSGTALATFFAPMLALFLGWHGVFGLALVPLAAVFLVFLFFAQDSPTQPEPRPLWAYTDALGHADTWWFCVLYSVTFGGFVGLASFLNAFFKDQYFPTDVASGEMYASAFTTLCVVAGSMLRPVGGYLADRFGGVPMLVALFACSATALLGMVALPPVGVALVLLFLAMGCLGMANGSVFQLVPLRFPKEIGVVTGIVGAAGGVGGFFLPTALGLVKGQTGSYAAGFALFAVAALGCVGLMLALRGGWQRGFLGQAEELRPAT
jgi:NNP family nitrate/nitrite transporter-like MFS transporter